MLDHRREPSDRSSATEAGALSVQLRQGAPIPLDAPVITIQPGSFTVGPSGMACASLKDLDGNAGAACPRAAGTPA